MATSARSMAKALYGTNLLFRDLKPGTAFLFATGTRECFKLSMSTYEIVGRPGVLTAMNSTAYNTPVFLASAPMAAAA